MKNDCTGHESAKESRKGSVKWDPRGDRLRDPPILTRSGGVPSPGSPSFLQKPRHQFP